MRYVNPKDYDYVDPFVPLDLNFMNSAIQAKQKSTDTDLAEVNTLLDPLKKIKVRYQDVDRLKSTAKQYDQRGEDLVAKIQSGTPKSSILTDLTKLRNDLNTDLTAGNLFTLANNKAVYDQYNVEKLTKKNYTPAFDDNYFTISDDAYSGAWDDQGNLNNSSLRTIDEPLEYEKKADEIVKGIEAIGGGDWRLEKGANGQTYIVNRTGERVDQDKITNTFLPAWENTLENAQLNKEANYYAKVAGVDPNEYLKTRKSELLQFVVNKYLMNKSTARASGDPYGLRGFDQQLSAYDTTPHVEMGTYDPVEINPILKTAKEFFSPDGKIQKSKVIPKTLIGSVGESGEKAARAAEALMGLKQPKNADYTVVNPDYDKQVKLLEDIRKTAPNATKGLTDAEVLNLHAESLGSTGQVSYKTYNLDGMDINKINDVLLSNLSGKKIMVTGDTSITTLPQAAKKLGLNGKELDTRIKTAKTNGIKPTSPNNPGSWKVTVVGGDNLPHDITISADLDQQRFFTEFDELLENDKQGIIGSKNTNNYYSISNVQEVPVTMPNGAVKYNLQYGTVIYPKSNPKDAVTLDEITKQFGSIKNAEAQGHVFVKNKSGKYDLILSNSPINVEDFGRQLVHDWNATGLKNYQQTAKKNSTYSTSTYTEPTYTEPTYEQSSNGK